MRVRETSRFSSDLHGAWESPQIFDPFLLYEKGEKLKMIFFVLKIMFLPDLGPVGASGLPTMVAYLQPKLLEGTLQRQLE